MNRLITTKNARFSLIGLLLAVLFYACDTLIDDSAPQGDDLLLLQTDRQIQRGASIIFDLKQITRTSTEVVFDIGRNPQKGTLDFLDNGLLRYDPHTNFLSGKDLFSVQILSDGTVLDTDTVIVEMVSDSTDLPCFAGALSEFYYLGRNESIQFNPILNDGFCPDRTSEVQLTFDQPLNGAVQRQSDVELLYTPNQDFEGEDSFVYNVNFVDLDGNSHSSSSIVEFTIGEPLYPTDSACNIWPSRAVTFDVPLEEFYDIKVSFPAPACTWPAHFLEIVSVTNGSAEFLEGQEFLRFFPDNPGPSEKLWFDVVFENGDRFERYLELFFNGVAGDCPKAVPDSYLFEGLPDSVGAYATEWVFDPSENDSRCSDAYEIALTSDPDFGQISVVSEGKKMLLKVSEEFAGEKSMEVTYKLCDQGACDSSEITITVKR